VKEENNRKYDVFNRCFNYVSVGMISLTIAMDVYLCIELDLDLSILIDLYLLIMDVDRFFWRFSVIF
jgi:hypothetical protein